MPSTIQWTNPAGGDWSVPGNWNPNRLPMADDDVMIPTLASNVSITHATGTDTVQSITSGTTLILSGGTLTVTGNLALSTGIALTLKGGTLADARVVASGTGKLITTNSGGKLDGVTVNGPLDLTADHANAAVLDGLTLNGTATLGPWARLYFNGSQTLGGMGTVVFQNQYANALIANTNGMALTIGPQVTVRGGGNFSGSAEVGYSDYWGGGSDTSLVNEGTISADSAALGFTVFANLINNQGRLQASNGGRLTVNGLTGNLGSATLSGTGSQLNLSGSNYVNNLGLSAPAGTTLTLHGAWSNPAGKSITATNATLNLGGVPGVATPTAGNLLQNPDAEAGPGSPTGDVVPVPGWTTHGNFTAVRYGASGGFPVPSDRGPANRGLNFFAGGPNNGASSASQTVDVSTQALAIDAGWASYTLSGFLGGWDYQNDNAVITASFTDAQGRSLGSNTIGPVTAADRGSQTGFLFRTTSGTIPPETRRIVVTQSMTRTDGSYNDGYADNLSLVMGLQTPASFAWNNAGTITANGGTVNLGGSFTRDALGNFSGSGATVNVTGTLDNTNRILAITAGMGSWNLTGGTIRGGAVNEASGSPLSLTGSGGTLDGVTVNGDLRLTANNAYADILNGLSLNGTATLGANARLVFHGSQTLSGIATVLFQNGVANGLIAGTDSMTLTIGPSVTVRGGSSDPNGATVGGNGFWGSGNNISLVLQGTITADTPGPSIRLLPTGTGSLTNTGTIAAQNGGSLSVSASLTISDQAVLSESPSSALLVKGNLLAATPSAAQYNVQGQVTLNGTGTASAPQLLEAPSQDLGTNTTAFNHNDAYGTVALAGSTYVKLVSSSGAGSKAVYTNSLIVPAGTTLDLNGIPVYVRAAQIAGRTMNGTPLVVPNTGPLTLGTPTAGTISPAGKLDDWSFYGRAGSAITVAVNPGTSGAPAPIAPQLNWAQVQLLAADNTVLATAVDNSAGAIVTLPGVRLTADGVYRVRVTNAPGHSPGTGNYIMTAWDTTPAVRPVNVNETTLGMITTPYSKDQWTFTAAANTQVQFVLQGESASGLAFSLTGPNGFMGFTNLTGSSGLVNLSTAGTYMLSVLGTGGATGTYTFQMAQTSQTVLTLGTPSMGMLSGSGQAQLFRVSVPSTQVLSIRLSDAVPTDHNELYARFGAPPTRAGYDYRFASPGNNQSLLVPSAASGTWYILVYAESGSGQRAFTLTATGSTSRVTAITPDHAGNGSPAMLTLTGAGFTGGTTVALVASDGMTTYAPTNLSIDSFTRITATFSAGLPVGVYSVRVTTSGNSDTLPAAFTLTAGGVAHLQTNLVLPSSIGRHAPATLYVTYANTGTVAMPAPLLVLSNPNDDRPLMTLDQSLANQGFWTSAIPDGFSTTISILASGRTPGLLQAGESVTVPVFYAGLETPWYPSHTTIPFNLGVIYTTDTTPINWNSLKSGLKPSWISTGAWDPIYSAVTAQAGNTSGSYVQMLDSNAQYLGRLGESVTDVGQLWNFSILQANGLSPVSTLASAVDASMVTPGLSLAFGRSLGETINSRYQFGPLGFGWSVPWQLSLSRLPDGTVTITADGGNQFRYQPDSRYAGRYFAAAGDMNTLTAGSGGIFVWKQMDGTTTHFLADGKLDYVQDTNGNKITAGYNASGQLTTLTHYSSGQSLTLAYNAAGLIHTITDSAGRQAVYTYDTANQHLMRVQTPGGTTQYTYSVGNGAATEHALTSIQFPDGSHLYYTYDALGRLASTSRDGNAERVNYTYDQPGEVTGTDLLGEASRTFYDYRGLPVKSQDALGNITVVSYDSATLMVSKSTDPTGQTQTFTYDAMGNLASSTDQLGHKTVYTHGIDNRLTSLTDANGNKTVYAYDPSGNLLSTTYANGSVERSTFDPLGNPKSFTNRNGQAISYIVNAAGQVTREAFPDTTHTDFTYDAHGNLKTAVDATGTITFTYDTADRLTRVDYPNGEFLQFTLDPNSGRRMSMVDQTGFTVNYFYDPAGRLWYLTDGSNNRIVTYTYDPAGRLSRKDNGNSTYTTYQYDANGNVLHLINYAPGGAVNSRFDYTYNSLSQRTTMATVDGTWTYSYDGTGQLTHAVFASTNSNVPSQDLVYDYDAMGNRTSTVINGVTTTYVSNNVNEYTSIGGVTQTYDADGNLLSDGTDTYTYDVLDRLRSVTTSIGTTAYAYDPLGNRSSITTSGQITYYLNDPLGLSSVVGEFDGNGNLIAHATYGLGLTNQILNGNSYYYDFDAIGSTVGVTSSTGMYVDKYSYLPFGGILSSTTAVSNGFQFIGQFGIATESSGLQFMRSRYYSPRTGKFLSPDPLRLLGGSNNLTLYSANNPVSYLDPRGTVLTPYPPVPIPDYVDDSTIARNQEICNQEYGHGGTPTQLWVCTDFGFRLPGTRDCLIRGRAQQPPDNLKNPFWGWNEITRHVNCWFFPTDSYPPPQRQPDVGPGTPGGGGTSKSTTPQDPNDKLGPIGYAAPNFIQAGKILPYRIDFENDKTATAPAQAVTITDQLASTLDWSTFRLTEIGFGDTILTIPPDTQHYQTTVSMTYNGKTFDVLVEAGIHTDTGLVYATFQSIDRTTDLPPDVLTGFLPPEDGTGRGMGHISYTILPKAGLPTGTEIRNVALVTFDQNDPIATDQVDEHDPSMGTDPNKEALVTIDAGPPTSSVNALPAQSPPTFLVTWAGADDAGGSGVAFFDIYVSDNNGPFTLWLGQTTRNQAAFTGVFGHTYAFYSVATDNVGNREATPMMAQATTAISIAATPTHFQVVPSATSLVAGTPFMVTVRVLDDGNNVVAGYTGTVHFGSSDPQAGLPADYTFTAADQGVHTFTVTLFTAGIQLLTVGDAAAGITGQAALINRFALPTASSGPGAITRGPDGNLWFVETSAGQIGRIGPDGTVTEFRLPTPGSRPTGIVTGPDGNLWFTEFAAGQIGMISPDGSTVMEFPLPTPNSGPEGITVGPDGNIWFTEYTAGQVGMITPDGSTIMEFALPTPNSGPMGITLGPDGNLWFTEFLAGQIGVISPDGSTLTEFALPTPNSGPMGIAAGPDGFVWFTEFNANQVGSIGTDGSVINEFAIGTLDSGPTAIVANVDGNLWFTEANANQIGQITAASGTVGQFNEIPLSMSGLGLAGITDDSAGNLWFSESQASAIGELIPVFTITAAPADHFVIVAMSPVTPGMPFDITVLAEDPYGNVDTNYQGTIHFTVTDPDPGVVLPADYTFQPGDAGMVTFSGGVTLITPGDQVLTVTDLDTGLLTGNATVTVSPGPAPSAGKPGLSRRQAASVVGLPSWAVIPPFPETAVRTIPIGAPRTAEARPAMEAPATSIPIALRDAAEVWRSTPAAVPDDVWLDALWGLWPPFRSVLETRREGGGRA